MAKSYLNPILVYRREERVTKLFFFPISSYYIKLPDHTNHATDLKSRFLGKEKKMMQSCKILFINTL